MNQLYYCPFCNRPFDSAQKRGSHISQGHHGEERQVYVGLPLEERTKRVITLPEKAETSATPLTDTAVAMSPEEHLRFAIAATKAALADADTELIRLEGVKRERGRLAQQLDVLTRALEELAKPKAENGGNPGNPNFQPVIVPRQAAAAI